MATFPTLAPGKDRPNNIHDSTDKQTRKICTWQYVAAAHLHKSKVILPLPVMQSAHPSLVALSHWGAKLPQSLEYKPQMRCCRHEGLVERTALTHAMHCSTAGRKPDGATHRKVQAVPRQTACHKTLRTAIPTSGAGQPQISARDTNCMAQGSNMRTVRELPRQGWACSKPVNPSQPKSVCGQERNAQTYKHPVDYSTIQEPKRSTHCICPMACTWAQYCDTGSSDGLPAKPAYALTRWLAPKWQKPR